MSDNPSSVLIKGKWIPLKELAERIKAERERLIPPVKVWKPFRGKRMPKYSIEKGRKRRER